MRKALLLTTALWFGAARAQSVSSNFLSMPALGPTSSINSNTLTWPGVTVGTSLAQAIYNMRGLDFTQYYLSTDAGDYAPALGRAYGQLNTWYGASTYTAVYVPPGAWSLQSAIATFPASGVPAALEGDLLYQSGLNLSAAFTGQVFTCDNTVGGTLTSGALPSNSGTTGCSVSNLVIVGNRNSTSQDGIIAYDGNDKLQIHNVAMYALPGYGLAIGLVQGSTNGQTREVDVSNVRCEYCGTSTKPAFLFSSTGTNDASNQWNIYDINTFSSTGDGIAIENNNTNLAIRKIKIYGGRSELSGGYNWRFGSDTVSSSGKGITQIMGYGLTGVSPAAGFANFYITSPAGAAFGAESNSIFLDGVVSETGSGTGDGVHIHTGHFIDIGFDYSSSAGTQIILDSGVDGIVHLHGNITDASVTNNAPACDLQIDGSGNYNCVHVSSLQVGTLTPKATSILGSGTALALETGPLSSTAGDLLSFGANGNAVDSGVLATSLATAPPFSDCSATATISAVTQGDLSVSYGTQVCKYAKIPLSSGFETLVEETVTFTPTFTTASGAVKFGLPANVANITGITQPLAVGNPMTTAYTWPGNATYIAMSLPANQSYANLTGYKTGQGPTNAALVTNFATGVAYTVSFGGTYFSQ